MGVKVTFAIIAFDNILIIILFICDVVICMKMVKNALFFFRMTERESARKQTDMEKQVQIQIRTITLIVPTRKLANPIIQHQTHQQF